jgi:hypothetical protein
MIVERIQFRSGADMKCEQADYLSKRYACLYVIYL